MATKTDLIDSIALESGTSKIAVKKVLEALAYIGNLPKKAERGNNEEAISEADLIQLIDFIKECVAELQPKLAEANQKLDRLIKERAKFWQEIEEIDKEIAKYAHNR